MTHADKKNDDPQMSNSVASHAIGQLPEIALPDRGISVKIAVFHDSPQMTADHTPEHEHPLFEVSYMARGDMTYFVEGHRIQIDDAARKIIMIPPGVPHYRHNFRPPSVIRGFFIMITVHSEVGQRYYQEILEHLAQVRFLFEPDSLQVSLMNAINAALKNDVRDSLAEYHIEQLLQLFIAGIFKKFPFHPLQAGVQPCPDMGNREIAEYIFMRMEDLINRPYNASTLASYFALSDKHLNRIFKSETGKTIFQLYRERKLFHAERLLADPAYSIGAVATALGFSSQRNFSTFFKKHKGIVPGAFQKKLNAII